MNFGMSHVMNGAAGYQAIPRANKIKTTNIIRISNLQSFTVQYVLDALQKYGDIDTIMQDKDSIFIIFTNSKSVDLILSASTILINSIPCTPIPIFQNPETDTGLKTIYMRLKKEKNIEKLEKFVELVFTPIQSNTIILEISNHLSKCEKLKKIMFLSNIEYYTLYAYFEDEKSAEKARNSFKEFSERNLVDVVRPENMIVPNSIFLTNLIGPIQEIINIIGKYGQITCVSKCCYQNTIPKNSKSERQYVVAITFQIEEHAKAALQISNFSNNGAVFNARLLSRYDPYLQELNDVNIPKYDPSNNYVKQENKFFGILANVNSSLYKINFSSIESGTTDNIINYKNALFVATKCEKSPYLEIEFLSSKVSLYGYSLESAPLPPGDEHPHSWVLESLNESNDWVTIDKIDNTQKLNSYMKYDYFSFTPNNHFSSKFRFRLTKPNFKGTNRLVLSKFELYGNFKYSPIIIEEDEGITKIHKPKYIRKRKMYEKNEIVHRPMNQMMTNIFNQFCDCFELPLREGIPELKDEEIDETLRTIFEDLPPSLQPHIYTVPETYED